MRSLKAKLIVFVALLMVIVSTLIAVLVYGQMRRGMVEGVDHELSGTAHGYSAFVGRWHADKLQSTLAGNALANMPDPIPMLARLNEGGGFSLSYIGYPDHHIVYSDGHAQKPGYDPVARPWYQLAVSTGKAGVSAPYIASSNGKLRVTFFSPVFNDGVLKAVVGGDIPIDDLAKTVLSIKLRGEGFAFLADKNGNVIAHPDPQLTLKPLTQSAPELTLARLNAAAESGNTQEVLIEGRSMYVQIVPVEGTDWLMGIAMDAAVVSQPMLKVLQTIVVIVLVALAILVPIAGMLKGLHGLNRAMREISLGEGDLTRRIEVQGKDEIAETAAAFNTFIDHLQRMFHAVKTEADRVIGGVENLGSAMGKMAEDSREISDVTSSNAATLEQISVSISHIADAAGEADTLVTSTDAISCDSAADIGKIAQEIAHTVDAVKGLSSMLSALDQRSQQISGITNVIKDIADQTNLLALNAAIEAARAGDMGRGFAVVADEVRKLAERTTQATQEIARMVSAIRAETSDAVSSMQHTVSLVDGGAELTQSAALRIADIRVSMQSVVAKMNEISLSTSEQHNATTMIAQSTERINGRIIDSDNSLQTVHGNLSVLGEAALELQEMFSRFRV
ncbi:MAG: methyl-accepting chemotaxis protein [Proteobacteria bacterium]|nr:methyl-accepting chemotaxis protein [Pseudomonadota bacterium]